MESYWLIFKISLILIYMKVDSSLHSLSALYFAPFHFFLFFFSSFSPSLERSHFLKNEDQPSSLDALPVDTLALPGNLGHSSQ